MNKALNTDTVIPAQPGWFLIDPVSSGEAVVDIRLEPVLAWSYSADAIEPITIDGRVDGDVVLKRPDGVLTAPHARDFATLDDVLEYLQARHAQEQSRRAARSAKANKDDAL